MAFTYKIIGIVWRKIAICGEIMYFCAGVQYGKMNKKLPKYLLGKYQLLGTVTFSVLFAIVFLNLYIPFSDTAWFGLGNSVNFLATAGFMFISMLILIVSRVIMYKTQDMFDMTYLWYVIWCLGEVVVICMLYTFVTVDVTGPSDRDYLNIFLKSLLYGSIALIIPYIITGMYFTIMDKNRTISLMNCTNVISDDAAPARDSDKVTLFDSSGALRLSVSTDNLYYVESDDNYIKVWYLDARGELKTYMVRCRLKTVEQSFRGTSLVRCHRKYIVNLGRVKVLRKEKDMYWLDLDNDAIPPLPVSRTYTEDVLSRFMKDSPEKVSESL